MAWTGHPVLGFRHGNPAKGELTDATAGEVSTLK